MLQNIQHYCKNTLALLQQYCITSFRMSDAKLNTALMDAWIERNNPYGREKLAQRANRSVSFIDTIRRTRKVPRSYNLESLAAAMGVRPDDLVISTKKTAS